MAFFSGRDGSLYADGVRVARVSDWSLSSSVEALETTDLGMNERSYTPGLKSASGTCNVFYHNDDPVPLLKRVVQAGAATDADIVRLSLRWGQKKIDVDVLITQAGLSCQVGSVMQAAISFNVTGNYQDIEL